MEKTTKVPVSGGNWLPSPPQELLLRAALWDGDEARAAWHEWIGQVDIQYLDNGSYRLLPLLYLNLRALNIEHSQLERIHGVYRYHWYRNQLLMRRGALAVRALQAAQIPTMMLKASALIPLYYRNPGARPCDDIDILVPTREARRAMETLVAIGWSPWFGDLAGYTDQFVERHYAHTFRNGEEFHLDLHRHMMYFDTREYADEDFWAAAIPLDFEGNASHALCPADQLLHVCVHGTVWNPVSPIRWAADAFVVLRESKIDWERFVRQAAKRDLVLAARNEIGYLKTALRAPIPDEVIEALRKLPVSNFDRLQYRVNTLPFDERGAAEKLWYHYEHYRRFGNMYQNENVLLRFPAFLRDTWGLKTTREVPGHMARYALKKLGQRSAAPNEKLSLLKDES